VVGKRLSSQSRKKTTGLDFVKEVLMVEWLFEEALVVE